MSVPITITSDFICPWCLIGERRLAAAIASLPKTVSVSTEFLPYELNPDMQPEGMNRKIYRSLKFGSWERSQNLDAQTVAAASDTDIVFDYDAIERTPNTFLAHRLSSLARKEGRQPDVVRAVLSAYFEQGRDIGDAAVLTEIAAEQGLNSSAVEAALKSDVGVDDVRRLETETLAGGVRGVPRFQIGETEIGGAQPTAVLRNAILAEHARREASAA